MSVYTARVCVCTICVQCSWRPEDRFRASGPEFTDSCELLCVCWELNPCPVGEQSVVLIAELSLCPLVCSFC